MLIQALSLPHSIVGGRMLLVWSYQESWDNLMVPRRSGVQREDLLINICQATARASAVFIS
jgi:hypothetical protein